MTTMISGSMAWKILIKLGYDLSYPTALKWLRENGLASQIGGKYSTVLVDKERLERTIKSKKSVTIENRKPPGRKKN